MNNRRSTMQISGGWHVPEPPAKGVDLAGSRLPRPSLDALGVPPTSPRQFRNNQYVAFAATLMLVCLTIAQPAAGQMPIGPPKQILDQIGISPKLGDKVPLDGQFVDADGKPTRLGDLLDDRPVLLHLVYYDCPMLCKLSGDGLLRSLETLSLRAGKDFSIVTVSFDPREGPELSARARNMATERLGTAKVEGAWRFLTGQQSDIESLCDAVGFRYAFDEKTGQYAHASGVFVLTPAGTVSRFLTGIEYSPRDLRLAIVEASSGKVGTATDQIMLLCYMYDPTKGKYGFAIMSTLRIAGIATVGAMAIGIGHMLRRERRQGLTRQPNPKNDD
jgi:protein SCO1